ncbi:MAG: LytTR family transcriptional regulator [Bacteroidetes bacterium]|nr:LytTR family transcriptional regulator [Bacteroidota bacterium]
MKGFIEIADTKKTIVLPETEILRLATQEGYTVVYTKDRKQYVSTQILKVVARKLDPKVFFRIHKSHIINLKEVRTYEKGDGGCVTMSDGSIVTVARRQKVEFLKRLRS